MKNLILTLLLILSFQAKALDLESMCDDVDKLSGIVNSFSNVQWPVTGAPGIAMGVVSNPNAILEFCSLVQAIERGTTLDNVRTLAEYGNTLTGNKFDEEYNLLSSTLDLTETLYDFEGGGFRKDQLTKKSTARELNDYYKTVGDYYDNNLAKEGHLMDVKSKQQREANMGKIVALSSKAALLEEITNCPDPSENANKTNYSDIYTNSIKPQEEIIDANEPIVEEMTQKMKDMAVKISKNENEYSTFMRELGLLVHEANTYNVTIKTSSIKSKKKQKNGDKVEDVEYDKEIEYQEFEAVSTKSILEDFKVKYGADWNSYINSMATSSSEGLVGNYSGRIEEEYMLYDVECSDYKIEEKLELDPLDPRYESKVEKKKNECLQAAKDKVSNAGGLMNKYAEDIYRLNKEIKTAKAIIWTLESKHLGIYRNVTSGSNSSSQYYGDSGTSREVKCSDTPNTALLQKIANEQAKVSLQAQVETAKYLQQMSMKEDIKAAAEKRENEKMERVRQRSAIRAQRGQMDRSDVPFGKIN